MVKEECKALLDALNKVTACYRHMVLTIGGTSDSQNLREELKKTRQKAQELAVANRNKLTTVLKDKTVSKEDKAEFERLWVIFSTCLEILEIDMRRALELGHEFPLNVPKKHLIQTGMSGGTSGVAARAMSVQNMKYEAEHNIDVVDLKDLENEINQQETGRGQNIPLHPLSLLTKSLSVHPQNLLPPPVLITGTVKDSHAPGISHKIASAL